MKPFVLLGVLAMASFSAQAADGLQPRVGAAAAFGSFSGDNSPAGVMSGHVDDDAVGFKVYGQYPLNDWFAVEGAYYDSSKFKTRVKEKITDPPGLTYGQYELSFDGWSALGVVYIPEPVEGFQVYVKGGYYNFDDDLAVDGVNFGSSSERGLVLGGGMLLQMSDNLAVRADVDWFDADVGDLTTVNFGLEYSFGGTSGK